MNAGSIEISIAANYQQLQTALQQSVQSSQVAGQQAGQGFGQNFQQGQSRYIDRAIQDIQGKMTKAFGAVAIGNALAKTLEAGAAGVPWDKAITDAIDSIPIINIFTSIIESSLSLAFGNFEQEQKLARAREREAEAEEGLKAAQERVKAERDAARESSDASFRYLIQQAKALGNEKRAIELQLNQEIGHIQRERADKLAAAKSDAEKESIETTARLERAAAEDRAKFALEKMQKAQEEVAAKAIADDKERAQKLADETAKAEKKAAEETARAKQKAAEELQKRIAEAEEMKSEAAADAERTNIEFARSTGGMGTSFGTFTFKGYTDDEKRMVDQSILQTVKEINKKASELVGGGLG